MKCPICNGCINSTMIGNRHYWFCDFCRKYFIIVKREKVEVHPYEAKT